MASKLRYGSPASSRSLARNPNSKEGPTEYRLSAIDVRVSPLRSDVKDSALGELSSTPPFTPA